MGGGGGGGREDRGRGKGGEGGEVRGEEGGGGMYCSQYIYSCAIEDSSTIYISMVVQMLSIKRWSLAPRLNYSLIPKPSAPSKDGLGTAPSKLLE